MAAALTSYTNTAAVRACLGVDEQDCPDSILLDSNLSLELLVDLDEWLSGHAALYTAGTTTSPTTDEVRLKNLLVLYAQWFCAYELANRFLTVPQIVSDGKNQMNRFAKIDLAKAAELAGARRQKYRAALDTAVNNAPSFTSGIALMQGSVPDYDPVTNI